MRGLKRRYRLIMNLFIILIFEVEERFWYIYISIFIWKTHYRQVLHRRYITLRN